MEFLEEHGKMGYRIKHTLRSKLDIQGLRMRVTGPFVRYHASNIPAKYPRKSEDSGWIAYANDWEVGYFETKADAEMELLKLILDSSDETSRN